MNRPAIDDADIADLCFTARALAQTHPLTEQAHRYRQIRLDEERARQPVSELADWAGTALLVGYCLRRAEEESVAALSPPPRPERRTASRSQDELGSRARAAADELRVGDPDRVTLLSSATTVVALDRIIDTELDKRRDHMREQLDDEAWSELEDYISWWVVHGYGLRAGEAAG